LSDQKILGRKLGAYAGGTVANVACAVSLLEHPTLAYGRIGGDDDGRFLADEYRRFGVDTAHLRSVPSIASSTALIMVESSGEKALVYAPMAGKTLLASSLEEALAQSRILYATPYDLEEFKEVHRLSRQAGALIAIDVEAVMVPDLSHLQHLIALCDLVFMNDSTYSSIFRERPRLETMAELLWHGPQILVVTCGARGALAVTQSEQVEQAAFATTVIDSTGAGDSFNGAFLAALLEGQALAAALRFACAAGSIAVSATGARSALPTRARIKDRLLSMAKKSV
jgi:sugar/nucleoside kinase (ribokinase family)